MRSHAGPHYSREMAPLRPLLKAHAVFPPNKEQLQALAKEKEDAERGRVVNGTALEETTAAGPGGRISGVSGGGVVGVTGRNRRDNGMKQSE